MDIRDGQIHGELEDYEFQIGGVYLLARRDDFEAWQRENPVLGKGELGYDFTHRAFKRGDGRTPWRKLDWFLKVVD